MKRILLFISLITFSLSFSNESTLLKNFNSNPPQVQLVLNIVQGAVTVKVRNLSDKNIYDVYIESNDSYNVDFYYNFGNLAPFQETNFIFLDYTINNYNCEIEINANMFGYYYIDEDEEEEDSIYGFASICCFEYYDNLWGNQYGTYQDLNENGVVDVGDAINYTYSVFSEFDQGYQLIGINDNNAIVSIENNTATGIHFITQNEIDFGYVYNTAWGIGINSCGEEEEFPFLGIQCNGCPNPNNEFSIISITPLPSHSISGNIKLNLSNDGCATGLNFPRRTIKATTSNLNYRTFTDNVGSYTLNIPNIVETYTLDALENLNADFSSNPTTRTVNSNENAIALNYNNQDFCISVDTDFNDVSILFFNLNEVNPGFAANYQLRYQNNGTTVMNGTITLTFDDSKLQFTSATPVPDSVGASSLTWSYNNLLPFESRMIPVNFLTFVPPIVVAGDSVSFTATINPIADDFTPSNNIRVLNQIAVGSYDPNDKTVLEGAFISEEQVGGYLTYLTRFQNSGTANATFVIIREVLDENLDWSTFTPLAESHDAHIELREGNQLTYTFNDIDLPYEDIEPELSIGFMLYQIKLKPGFALGDTASSSSDIYFDFNPPIFTNVVTTQIAPPMNVNENLKNNFIIYPNPTASNISILMQEVVEAHYEITSITGERLSFGKVENINPIDVSFLSSSLYFISIITENERATFKLIKK